MGYAKYLEDIIDRLVEDLSANVPPRHLQQSLDGLDWPKVRDRKDNTIKSLQTKIKDIMTVRGRRH